MKIEQNKVVTLSYKLTNHKTGETIEETNDQNPLVFLYGVGSMIPDFEQNLSGKQIGDSFNFSITSDLAYGTNNPDQIVDLPLSIFVEEGKALDQELFFVGAHVPMSDADGNHLRGVILEINPEAIKMDFNHPLAGVDLHFEGEILKVRDASSDEIAHGHVHGDGGVHH